VEEVHNVVRVPTEAVAEMGGRHFVLLMNENEPQMTMVSVGKGNDEYIEVLSGLKENDRIAANAYQILEQFQQEGGDQQRRGMFPGMPGGGGGGGMRQLAPH
jgi:HlyD family secretion protein